MVWSDSARACFHAGEYVFALSRMTPVDFKIVRTQCAGQLGSSAGI
jgi:hypothetical protein